MRLTIVATAFVILGLSGVASAGEEALTLDLSVIPGGSKYFVKCSRSASLSDCGFVSLWEQTNGHPGLQTSLFAYGGRPIDPDYSLLP